MYIKYKDNGDNREYKLMDINRVVEEITIQRAPEKYMDRQRNFDHLAIECLIHKALYEDEVLDPVTQICQHIRLIEDKEENK